MPSEGEPAERIGLNRLDLLPQPRQRPATDAAQNVSVHPLAFRAARPELAFNQSFFSGQPAEQRFGDGDAQSISHGELTSRKRPVRSSVAAREIAGGVTDRLEQRLGDT